MAETARKRTLTVADPTEGNVDKCTCFVRRLPQNLTEEELLELFGGVGPVKKAFLVQEKGEAHHKGYAFVTFALADDAKKAVQQLANRSVKGAKLKVEPAQRRVPLAERHKNNLKQEAEDNDVATGTTQKQKRGALSTEQKSDLCKAVAVGGMSCEHLDAVTSKAKSLGTVVSINQEVPTTVVAVSKLRQDGCPDGAILVFYSSVKEAMDAVLKLHRCKLKCAGKTVKQWRLIIRNLPFSVDEGALIEFVSEAAFVWAASIPKDKSGKKKGFGFVSFTCRVHAAKAMEHVNSKKLKGRVLVADWSIPKTEFSTGPSGPDGRAAPAPAAAAAGEFKSQDAGEEEAASREAAGHEGPGGDNPQPVGHEHGGSTGQAGGSTPSPAGPIKQAAAEAAEMEGGDPEALSDAALHVHAGERRMYENVLAGLLSEEPKASDKPSRAAQKEQKGREAKNDSNKHAPGEHQADQQHGKQAAEPEDEKKSDKKAAGKGDKKKPAWEGERSEVAAAPAEEGSGLIHRQVFVRNLPLDVLSAELYASMQQFGEVKACRLVANKSTGKLKGTAFVEFQTVQGAAAACQSCASQREGKGDGVKLRGRQLAVDTALMQDKARSLAVQLGKSTGQAASPAGHKRNLHLAKEGRIEQGSPLWVQLSDRDQRKRLNSIKEVNLKLKSPNFFVSSTRLRLNNVPSTWSEKQLKACCHQAVLDRAALAQPSISQCVILRDAEKTDAHGQPKSRGCAFVEFESHEDALVCLRQMNNNPALFGGKSARPIVEFAVESVRALKIQKRKRHAIEDMKQQRSMAEVAPGEDEPGKKKAKKRKQKADRPEADSEPAGVAGTDQNKNRSDPLGSDSGTRSGQSSRKKFQERKRSEVAEGKPQAAVKTKKDTNTRAMESGGERASRKRPNKRTPQNADDLDRALSKRARQLFSDIRLY